MSIQKLNIQVQPHQPARASDFNATTEKVDELVDAVNTDEGRLFVVKGYMSLADADLANSADKIGIYYLIDGAVSGTLSVARDFYGNITQTLMSSVAITYNDAGQITYIAKPSVVSRTYQNGAWTRWTENGAQPDLTGYYKCVAMEQDDLEDLTCANTEEGVLYLGLGEVIDRPDSFRFGGTFPIKFT